MLFGVWCTVGTEILAPTTHTHRKTQIDDRRRPDLHRPVLQRFGVPWWGDVGCTEDVNAVQKHNPADLARAPGPALLTYLPTLVRS